MDWLFRRRDFGRAARRNGQVACAQLRGGGRSALGVLAWLDGVAPHRGRGWAFGSGVSRGANLDGIWPRPCSRVVALCEALPKPCLIVVTCHLPLPVCPTLDWRDWRDWRDFPGNLVTCQTLFLRIFLLRLAPAAFDGCPPLGRWPVERGQPRRGCRSAGQSRCRGNGTLPGRARGAVIAAWVRLAGTLALPTGAPTSKSA